MRRHGGLWAVLLLVGCGEGSLTSAAPVEGLPADRAPADRGGSGEGPVAGDAPGGAAGGASGDPSRPEPPDDTPPFEPAPPALHRLTRAQYHATVRHLLGDVTLPPDLEVDTPLHGFTTVGASETTISPRAAEQYEAAALDLSGQVVADPVRRAALVGCEPARADEPCVRDFLTAFGRRAWRRPLAAAEVDRLAALAADVGERFRDPWQGVRFAIAAVLQSPYFLFRVEIGEPDPERPGRRRYTSWEMASRLSYFLWNGPPDDALLEAAERGELVTDEGLRAQAERMLADPRGREAMRRYFAEYFGLDRLDHLEKDRELFPQMSPTLGASMRAEIEAVIDHLVFERDADIRELLTTRTTFVDAELAALYTLPPVEGDGLRPVELPPDGPRAGLLGMAGILALNAHNTVTSPTLRGKFIQNNLLCFDIPPPPPGVVTSLEQVPDDGPVTTREKLARHREDPTCNGCHQFMDPLGLGLENFDAIGAWRTTENGLPIDARSSLDGVPFEGPRELGELLRERPEIADCMARRMYRHATGHLEEHGEEKAIRALARRFVEAGYRVRALAVATVLSDGFRYAAEPAAEEAER